MNRKYLSVDRKDDTDMENLSCKIENLSYHTIENCITEFYSMGYASSSNFPIMFEEDTYGNYSISATKQYGEFSIRINKKTDGTYWLYVVPRKLKDKK